MTALSVKLAPYQVSSDTGMLHAKRTASSDTTGEIQGLTLAGELANRTSC